MSIFNDSRYRGYSLSAGRPVASLDLSYDHPSGAYAGLSASAVFVPRETVRPLGVAFNGGYAKRLSQGLTVDMGFLYSRYSRYFRGGAPNSETEAYIGVTHRFLSARIAYSPHYFEQHAQRLYGELDANFSPLHRLRFDGHVGLLVPVASPYNETARTQYDWRVGASREFGRASFEVALTGGGPSPDLYRGRRHSRTRLLAGVSYAL